MPKLCAKGTHKNKKSGNCETFTRKKKLKIFSPNNKLHLKMSSGLPYGSKKQFVDQIKQIIASIDVRVANLRSNIDTYSTMDKKILKVYAEHVQSYYSQIMSDLPEFTDNNTLESKVSEHIRLVCIKDINFSEELNEIYEATKDLYETEKANNNHRYVKPAYFNYFTNVINNNEKINSLHDGFMYYDLIEIKKSILSIPLKNMGYPDNIKKSIKIVLDNYTE